MLIDSGVFHEVTYTEKKKEITYFMTLSDVEVKSYNSHEGRES